jgi:hypothetical protein
MEKEKPLPLGSRVYKQHRVIIKRASKKLGISEAEVVRRAIQRFAESGAATERV